MPARIRPTRCGWVSAVVAPAGSRALRAVRASAASSTTRARRSGNADRPVPSPRASSAGGCPHSASEAASAPSAGAPTADSGSRYGPAGGGPDTDTGSGACSTTRWMLVPDQPNELTPARRGDPVSGNGAPAARSGRTGPSSDTMVFGVSRCRLPGSSPARSASTVLTSPAIPAAVSRCPTLVFTAPTCSGRWAGRSPNTSVSAPISMASPRLVPEPCASTKSMSPGARPASSRAWRRTASWACLFGAVRPLLCPSWVIAVPRMTAWVARCCRSASWTRWRTTAPPPSPITNPSAEASKVLVRPSPASMLILQACTKAPGSVRAEAATTTAVSHSPRRRL